MVCYCNRHLKTSAALLLGDRGRLEHRYLLREDEVRVTRGVREGEEEMN